MNKKSIIIVIAVLCLIVGGALGYHFYPKKSGNEEGGEDHPTKEEWNEYTTKNMPLVTLNDFKLSAEQGDSIVSLTVNLEFENEEALKKYKGMEAADEKEETGGHGGSSKEEISPMEIFINSKVSEYIFHTDKTTLSDKGALEAGLKAHLNEKLKEGENFIKHVYIENYVVQW